MSEQVRDGATDFGAIDRKLRDETISMSYIFKGKRVD